MKAAYKELRYKIIIGVSFDPNDVKTKNGLIKKYPGIDIEKLIDTTAKQLDTIKIKGVILFSSIEKFHTRLTQIESMIKGTYKFLNEIEPDKSNETTPGFPVDYLINALENSNFDLNKVKKSIEHIEKSARTIETKKDTVSAEVVRDFVTECKKYLLNDDNKNVRRFFTPKYSPTIPQIRDIKGTRFDKGDLIELAERCFDLLNVPQDSILDYQLVMLLIRLQCNEFKMEFPISSKMSICPHCGDKEQTGDICAKCHAWIRCPGCGANIIKGAQTCTGCGTEIDKIDTYIQLIKEVDKQLSATKNFIAVEKAIVPIKGWTKYEPLISLIKQIDEIKKQTIEYEKKLNTLSNERKYFEASALLVEMKQKVYLSPQVQEKDTEIKNAIDNAQRLFKETANLPADNQIEACSRILSLVTDFQPAINNLKQIKIKTPTLSADLKGTTVLLNWSKLSIPNASVEYIITRKEKSSPTIADLRIYAGSNNSCSDNNILSGISYFYGLSVKVNIQGVEIQSSSPGVSPEILSVSEVSKYSITTGDKYIQIDFESNASDYLLFRESEKGEKIQINDNLKTGKVTDRNVVNEVRYTYILISIYKKLTGETIKSAGIKLYATPQTPPKPILSLKFRKEAENIVLSWDTEIKETSNIYILYSAAKIDKTAGALIPIKDLKQLGTVFITTTPNQAIIPLNNAYIKNLFSIWTVNGDNAMFGSEVEIINIPEVSDLKAYISSGKLYVEWNYPANCRMVRVFYSNNSFDDKYKTIENYPLERYNTHKACVIAPVIDKDYFIEVATVNFDGKQEALSSGVRIKMANGNPMTISYSISVSSFLRKKLTLKIDNDSKKSLPELLLVNAANRIPVRKEDGSVIYVIPEGTACGTFELSSENIRKNYYARLFLSDTATNNIRIITPDKERLKLY